MRLISNLGMRRAIAAIAALMIALMAAEVSAQVALPHILGDNMVLQRDRELTLQAKASPGEELTVTIAGQTAKAKAGADGIWKAKLKALAAGGPLEMTIAGKTTITLKNILVGEVWVCSGQSNMDFTLKGAINGEQEVASATDPQLRLFIVKKAMMAEPVSDADGDWSECAPASAEKFSAVGYFFGRELRKELGVPVGLIHSAWGGTPAESWTTIATLDGDADFHRILVQWEEAFKQFPDLNEKYKKKLEEWNAAAKQARAEGKEPPRGRPGPPPGPTSPQRPAVLYNGMIAPLTAFPIRGAIWYQGESNAGRAFQYRRLFPAMINDWRKAWGEGDFPFLFVQLANYKPRLPMPGPSEWAELREAQTMALSLPNTGMAVTIDVGEAQDIHPKNKQEVGRRLALNALATVYGKKIEYSGPMYAGRKVDGKVAKVKFTHAEGLKTSDGADPKFFELAGEDQKFYWAKAKIEGDTVLLENENVAVPVAVRHGWADNPEVNLVNDAGLPASPFRTDDWPGLTVGK